MITVKKVNTKIVAVPNPYFDLLLIDTSPTLNAKSVVKNEVQADQPIKILVDTTPRDGAYGTRFRVMTLCGPSKEIRDYDFLTTDEIPASLLEAFDRALLKAIALPLDDWAQIKYELGDDLYS